MPQTKPQARFGTFGGVFTPTVLTILGLILYLRTGWVVGQAGLIGALAIIALANLVTFTTGLSIASIATNMRVRGGGAYYMISRTLGLEIGGAIGLPLYLSQAVSVAFYLIGFSESLVSVWPEAWIGLEPKAVSLTLLAVFAVLAWLGADFIIRLQYVILAVVALSLVSLFAGGWDTPPSQWPGLAYMPPRVADAGFWEVFAIFFPAVTGIMVGVSMSGDLKDPARSIPIGTLSAIVACAVVYMAAGAWIGLHATNVELIEDNMVMMRVARWPELILAGVWMATLSSALGSIMAAPRVLTALARDRVTPPVFARRLGSPTEPRLAVLVTAGIACGVILMGDLDAVAPVITMFFLNTYGMINLASGLETLVGNPSYRPRFKTPWSLSLAAAAACYGAMLLINPTATAVAVVLSYGVYLLLTRRTLKQQWGDLSFGLWYSLARFGLLKLDAEPWTPKNWRPNLAVFTGPPADNPDLIMFGLWMAQGKGVVRLVRLIEGDPRELAGKGYIATARKELRGYIEAADVEAFAAAAIVPEPEIGLLQTLSGMGLEGLAPNAALQVWPERIKDQAARMDLMRSVSAMGKSSLFLKSEGGLSQRGRIDVWWRGKGGNADLMLLTAYILRSSRDWREAKIRILRVVAKKEAIEGATEAIREELALVRVAAEPKVMVLGVESFPELLYRESEGAGLTLMGLPMPESAEDALEKAEAINEMTRRLDRVLFVRSGEQEDILEG